MGAQDARGRSVLERIVGVLDELALIVTQFVNSSRITAPDRPVALPSDYPCRGGTELG